MIKDTPTSSAQNTEEYRAWGQYPAEITPLPTSTPTPTPTDIRSLICSYPWSCDQALRVAMCESTMNPRAVGGNNYGLFQINGVHGHSIDNLFDPEYNVRVAYQLYATQGWGPWACKP